MSTSIQAQRGTRSLRQRMFLPIAFCSALVLVTSCGNDADGGGGTDPGAEDSTAPVIDTVLPNAGPPSGGTLLTLTGSGFLVDVEGDTIVTLDGVEAMDVIIIDDTTLTLTTPPSVNDTLADVEVINSRGTGSLSDGFHYLATSTILSDLNSDGVPDIVIAAGRDDTAGESAGAVYIFYGASEDEVLQDSAASASDVVVLGAMEGDRLGSSLATGDVNADGHTDLVIGAPRSDNGAQDAGEVLIFLGPLPESASLSAADADIILTGEGTRAGAWYGVMGDLFGSAIALGDLDGDAVLDICVGAPGADLYVGESGEVEDAGRAYVFTGGGLLESMSADQATMIVEGGKESDELGSDVCLLDINADGLADLAAGFDVALSGANHRGSVAIFTELVTSASIEQADIVITSLENGDLFGGALSCGDINGDGAEDMIIGASGSNALGSVTGRVYVFLGAESFDSRFADAADVIFSGQISNARFGSELASADVNGDGIDDTLVGAPFTSYAATWDGQVFVFFGNEAPVDTVAYHGDVVITGESMNGERFGSSIEVLDCDSDGVADLMSAATGHGGLSGRVYMFHGEEGLSDQGADSDDLTLTGESEGGSFGSSISRGK